MQRFVREQGRCRRDAGEIYLVQHLVREHAAQPAAVLDAQVLEELVELGVGQVQVLRRPKRLAQLACTVRGAVRGAGCGVRGAGCGVRGAGCVHQMVMGSRFGHGVDLVSTVHLTLGCSRVVAGVAAAGCSSVLQPPTAAHLRRSRRSSRSRASAAPRRADSAAPAQG